ncbi:MAG: flagellar basal-body rod protein FlgF [bacterium]
MIRGLYTGASGMVATQQRMDVISNNLSNSNTTGYKSLNIVNKAYPEKDLVRTDDNLQKLPMGTIDKRPPLGSLNTGVTSDGTYTNFSQGQLRGTEDQLDLALEGEGFFVVQTDDGGEAYTRDGSFTVNSDNELVTTRGKRVMGLEGVIQIPEDMESLSITGRGQIVDQDNNILGNIQVAQFENPVKMEQLGDNMFRQGENNPRIDPPENYKIHQGFLERSNVDAIKQMIDMIEVNRHNEVQSTVIKQQNKLLGQAISRVGRA